jgi:hypothetical protein
MLNMTDDDNDIIMPKIGNAYLDQFLSDLDDEGIILKRTQRATYGL